MDIKTGKTDFEISAAVKVHLDALNDIFVDAYNAGLKIEIGECRDCLSDRITLQIAILRRV